MTLEAPSRDARDRRLSRVAVVLIATIGGSLAMTLGFLMKWQCAPPNPWDGRQWTRNCYTDMLPLYGDRGGDFAYRPECEPGPGQPNTACRSVPFARHGLAFRDNRLEYPALTGLYISAANAAVKEGDAGRFIAANAFGLALFGIAAAAAIAAIAKRPARIALFVLAPALVSYAFLNWDLLAVGLMALGLWAFARDRDVLAGALLGLGAAAKMFPGLIVPALMLARRREGKPAWPLMVYAALWFAIPNVVVLLYAGVDGWSYFWKFQSARLPNYETSWFFALHHGTRITGPGWNDFWYTTGGPFTKIAQYGSLGLFAVTSLLLLWRESLRAEIRPFTTAFGILLLFLLTTKVFSPQYALWILPFFALVRVPWHAFAAFALTDVFVLGGIWAYLGAPNDFKLLILEIAVFARYAALGYVLFWTRRAGEDLVGEPETQPAGAGSAAAVWAGA